MNSYTFSYQAFWTILIAYSLIFLPLDSAQSQHQRGSSLPDGTGKTLVEQACISCHSISTITRSGFDGVDMWRSVQESMMVLPEEDAEIIAQYLSDHFPAKKDRKPNLIDGPVDIDIREWIVPTLGQRSRDPIEAPDGSIWWTGMWASLVGRLDPITGAMKEFPLPPDAKPHSIIPDDDGSIWYTGNNNGTIGKLDPTTGDITEYPTKSKDPHTAIFHPNGQLYFTSQRSAMLGRLNPVTGELTEIDTEPRPYGIIVDHDGMVWVAYNGTNKLARMHPESMVIQYYSISDDGTRIRRLGVDSKGMIWYVNSTMGRIGRLNPDTGSIKEWDSPSGARSHPYALAVINDKIWYNESAMRPDALVRFDPETESFQSWAIPSGVGIIRHVWVTRDNKILIHQSSSNRVGLVTIHDLAN